MVGLLGQLDELLRLVEAAFPVQILVRGNEITITGGSADTEIKGLNTVNAAVMVEPAGVPGEHDLFVCGDEDAKREVCDLLESFGWPAERIVDLGDITGARGMEMYLPLWLRMMAAFGTPGFNIHVAR